MHTRRIVDDETFRRLCRARDLAHAFYASRLDTPTLAREAALSPWHFHRLFTAAFGETPHDFLTALRMARARELLASGRYSVTETCFEAGYTSLGSFSTKFRDTVGLSPADYACQVRRVFGPAAQARSQFIPTCFLSLYAGDE